MLPVRGSLRAESVDSARKRNGRFEQISEQPEVVRTANLSRSGPHVSPRLTEPYFGPPLMPATQEMHNLSVWWRTKILVSLALSSALFLLIMLWAACLAAQTETVLETPLARIHHQNDQEALANTAAEALEFARQSVGTFSSLPHRKLEVYLYDSAQQMTDGLMETLGQPRHEAAVIAAVGFSAVANSTLHIHARRADKSWYLFWHGLVREYAKGMAAERYGANLSKHARWLYEGLGEFEANRALSKKFEAFEEDYARSRFEIAFKALIFCKLPRFKNIVTKEGWHANLANSRGRWAVPYAQAYMAVNYLITGYGFDQFAALLTEIKNGGSVEEAMMKIYGLSPLRFEVNYYSFMLLNGLFGLYLSHTLALLALLCLLVLGLFLLLKRRRAAEPGARGKPVSPHRVV